jgi:hypothetical protein
MYSTVCHSDNLRRAVGPNISIIASLDGPPDVMEINFGSLQYLLRMSSSGATKLRFQHCLSKVGLSELALMYCGLAFCFSLCHKSFGVNRVLGDRDSLMMKRKELERCLECVSHATHRQSVKNRGQIGIGV